MATNMHGFEIRQHAGSATKFYIGKVNKHGKKNRWYHLKYKTVNLSEQEAKEIFDKIVQEYTLANQGKGNDGAV